MTAADFTDRQKLPKHIAVIMDGNGRWAQSQGMKRIFGHREGVRAVRECAEACAELQIPYLTLYAFSAENWSRPKEEVNALMRLLVDTVTSEMNTFKRNNIRLNAFGALNELPDYCRKGLSNVMNETAQHTGLTLSLALSYSARNELVQVVRTLAERVQLGALRTEDIDAEQIAASTYTSGMPDPELMIRTSGEQRISNFLLWQLAYAELYFTPVLWPDFKKEHLYLAISDFLTRERRFGKTGEQIQKI